MLCPRCGNEWDVSKSPCSRCGLQVRLPHQAKRTKPAQTSPANPMPGREKQARADEPARFDPQTSPGLMPGKPLIERPSAKHIPSRPQTSQLASPVTPFPDAEVGRSATPFRPKRLVTEKEETVSRSPQMRNVVFDPSTLPGISDPPALPGSSGSLKELRVLMPGTLLRNGRYRLRELQGRQDWLSGVYEAMWVAQDAQRNGSQVMICELSVPESNTTMMVQSMLRTATMALTSAGRHARVPTLWDAFSDQGQNFFVFESIDGESLLARIRRTGRPLPEQDVVALCLQIVELLDLLSQQSPPLVHGLIRPEYVMINPSGTQYLLTNFSVILAGGATQFVSGVERSQLSPFTSPDLSRGVVDVRLDLYSLLATAYYAVTGSIPDANSGNVLHSAQAFNPAISAAFDAILMRGLRPIASQRYQRPSELRQDLLRINPVSGPLISRNEAFSSGQAVKRSAQRQSSISVSSQSTPDTVAQMLPGMVATSLDDELERGLMLPKSEELPPLEQRNDTILSFLWVFAILVGLIVLVVLGRALL